MVFHKAGASVGHIRIVWDPSGSFFISAHADPFAEAR